MIREIEIGEIYLSRSNKEFIVDYIGRHAQDCSQSMVVYRNLLPTDDAPKNTVWVLSESIFLKRFNYK